jgi:hypothetical protein
VPLGDADFRKSLIKIALEVTQKSVPTRHLSPAAKPTGVALSEWYGEKLRLVYACGDSSLPAPYLQPFILLRSDANKHLAGWLETVWSLELAQLLFNFGPSQFTISVVQAAHELPKVNG